MAASRDNMDEEMMNIINTGTQFADGDQQDVDDGSQYLALEDNQENIVQENTGEGYIYIYIYFLNIYHLLCVHMILIYSFLYVALWIDDHNVEKQKNSRPEKPIGGALHNIGIQYRDRRTIWSTCKEIRATLWVPCKGQTSDQCL
jgi:hypothetical protein